MTLDVFELSGSQVSWSKCRHSTSTTIKALVKNLSKLPLDKLNISKNGYFAFLYKSDELIYPRQCDQTL